MRDLYLLILLLFVTSFTFAQSIMPEVISCGGNYFANSNYSIAYTIGEPVIETIGNTNNKLTQGFHQGLYNLVNINKQINNPKITIYPNPTSDFINIDIVTANTDDYKIQLFDDLGKRLISVPYKDTKQISLQKYARSTYFIKILNIKNNKFNTYKVLKR